MDILPDDLDGESVWLFLLLGFFSLIGFYILSEVVWTLFLAVTFAYVLFPVKEKIHGRRFSDRQSAAVVTAVSFFLLILILTPIFIVLFQRRKILIDFISGLPGELSFEIFEFSFTYSLTQVEPLARNWVTDTALKLAESLPSLSLKAFLFIFLMYAILKHPRSIRDKILGVFPDSSKDSILSYHERIKKTLVGIFAVQLLTAVLTFIVALPVFYFLEYSAYVSLSVLSGLLQFLPVIGPSLLIVALAGLELLASLPFKASMVFILGVTVIGFLPDAYLRPKLADKTTGLPASLYFIGFVGGALTLGPIGILAGPLVIAVILETMELLID